MSKKHVNSKARGSVRLRWAVSLASSASVALAAGVVGAGEVVFDGTLGVPGSILGPTFAIPQDRGTLSSSGENLFHSFDRFNLDAGEIVQFAGNAGIQNVIARVTGGTSSTIDGVIDTRTHLPEASFWFINPAGIIVGANASFDVSGSIGLGAADSIKTAAGEQWVAMEGNWPGEPSSLFSVNPQEFGFIGPGAGALSAAAWAHDAQASGSSIRLAGGAGVELRDVSLAANLVSISSPNGDVMISGGGIRARAGGLVEVSGEDVVLEALNLRALSAFNPGRIVVTASGDLESSSVIYDTSAFGVANQAGIMELRAGGDLSISGSHFQNSLESNGSEEAVRGRSSITLLAGGHLSFVENSTIEARLSVVEEVQAATDVTLDGASVLIRGGSIDLQAVRPSYNRTDIGLGGNAGNITIVARGESGPGGEAALHIADGAQLTTRAVTIAAGEPGIGIEAPSFHNAASISLSAPSGTILVTGGATDGLPQTLIETTAGANTGSAGRVTVSAREIRIDGARINSSTASTNVVPDSGDIQINADEAVVLNGAELQSESSGRSRAGDIVINGASIQIAGGVVSASTTGGSDGGNVGIRASSGAVRIDSSTLQSASSGAQSGAAGAIGLSGSEIHLNNAVIATSIESMRTDLQSGPAQIGLSSPGAITLTNSLLDARTSGEVSAGAIDVHGASVTVRGGRESIGVANTAMTTSTSGTGDGGNIAVVGETLLVANATLSSQTSNEGNAGSICVAAGTSVCGQPTLPSSGGLTLDRSTLSTSTTSSGAAGSITVSAAEALFVSNGSIVQSASSAVDEGAGAAGSILLSGASVALERSTVSAAIEGGNSATPAANITVTSGDAGQLTIDGTQITTRARAANGGDININGGGSSLSLRDALIQASAGEGGAGGDILIDRVGQTIMQRTRILAQAEDGDGGAININLMPGAPFVRDTQSYINADSDSGNDGEVNISTPDVDLNGAIQPQDVDVSSPPELAANACAAGAGRSTFVSAGKGGVAPGPESYAIALEHQPQPSASRNRESHLIANSGVADVTQGCL